MSDKKKAPKENTEPKDAGIALGAGPSAASPEKTAPGLREEAVSRFWEENNIFEKSLARPSPKGNFVFYDGPPYATGLPHYGHLLQSTVKDVIPRYKTMRGYNVPRRWGWDCHGLPIENIIEKELKLPSKKAIEDYGIDKFNKAARDSVFKYAHDWKKIISRLGRWVDMDNDFQTMDSSYTESVWWSFKTLAEKKLVYEAYKVMPFCPRCQTTLSNFEVGQGYKDIPDISVYAKFELADEPNTFLVAWTTTPWTLPGNMALAINSDLKYVRAEIITGDSSGQTIICSQDRLANALEKAKILPENVKTSKPFKGAELEGKTYKPVFDFYTKSGTLPASEEPKRENLWKIYATDFVTAEDGTGVVHIAAFGEDDFKLATAKNIPIIQHVAKTGEMTAGNGSLSGMNVKPKEDPQKTDIEVIKLMAASGTLFAKEKIIHSYPHCWRCETPLLNYATSSWFIRVTDIREKLVAENKKINWVPPEVGEGRFGDWIENVRDWAVSRTRYWGAPLPIWRGEKTGKLEFIGSVAELKEHIQGSGNTFMLMRHGECESNIQNVINSGEKDLNKFSLTERGRFEVEETATGLKKKEAERGKKITKIYASDFRRTRETAEQMADALGVDRKHIVYDKRLREISAGEFDGQSWSKRADFFHSLHDKIFKQCPNGEAVVDVKRRTAEFMYELDAKHNHEDILVVTHGLPLRLMIDTVAGKTARDLLRSGWRDISDPTGSVHEINFKPLPHNEDYELDIHRPYVDAVTWTTPDGDIMRRVPEVFDVWYDAGSMPFAQAHYPFENKEEFDAKNSNLFPADFIAEGLDQTRGWFYTMLVIGVGLFDRSPYKNVAVTGLILAEDGRKMSKSLKNFPDAEPTLEKYGADALRYFLISSPAAHAEEMAFSEKSLDEVNKKIFNRLENVYSFYALYEGDAIIPQTAEEILKNKPDVLDEWILSRLSELKSQIEKGLDSYQFAKATRPVTDFVDDLSTWYLRRSRDRFKAEDEAGKADKTKALATTGFVLHTFTKIIAPFVPFISESIYRKLNNANNKASNLPESVHLCDWPELPEKNERLLKGMDAARKIVETGLALRSKAGIRNRQPLALFQYDKKAGELSVGLEKIIGDELNVEAVKAGVDYALDTNITEDLKEKGAIRDLMRAVQDMRKEAGFEKDDSAELSLHAANNIQAIVLKYEKEFKNTVKAGKINFVNIEDANANDGADENMNVSANERVTEIDLEYGKVRASILKN